MSEATDKTPIERIAAMERGDQVNTGLLNITVRDLCREVLRLQERVSVLEEKAGVGLVWVPVGPHAKGQNYDALSDAEQGEIAEQFPDYRESDRQNMKWVKSKRLPADV
jgi:hypothetical protein